MNDEAASVVNKWHDEQDSVSFGGCSICETDQLMKSACERLPSPGPSFSMPDCMSKEKAEGSKWTWSMKKLERITSPHSKVNGDGACERREM
jgi:hypothetical protein